MNKKQKIITLALLLYFPVFAHARVVYYPVHLNEKRGEFASPEGEFDSSLGIPFHGEFKTSGIFSQESAFKDTHSEELRSSMSILDQENNEFRTSNSILNTSKNEFKSPDQGEFKFSLP